MARMSGVDAHRRRLRALKAPNAAAKITRALFAGGQRVQLLAQVSITAGATSGENHVASAPGSAPNNDTGVLANNIEAAVTGMLKVEVTSNAPYAAIQEFGGTIKHPGGTPYFIGGDGKPRFVSNQGQGAFHNLPKTNPHDITLPERPYMRPAAAKARPVIAQLITKTVNAILKGAR